jgi:hypothetical protein
MKHRILKRRYGARSSVVVLGHIIDRYFHDTRPFTSAFLAWTIVESAEH